MDIISKIVSWLKKSLVNVRGYISKVRQNKALSLVFVVLALFVFGIFVLELNVRYERISVLDDRELVKKDSLIGEIPFTQRDKPTIFYKEIDRFQTFMNVDKDLQLIAEARLPLKKVDYYQGKFANAKAGAKQLSNRLKSINGVNAIYLVKQKIINMQAKYGYVNTPKGFAFGVCWAVTALGYAQNVANEYFEYKFNMPLFVFLERHPHSHVYETYKKVNNGRGYAIYESPSHVMDYGFKINPRVYKVCPGAIVKVEIGPEYNPQAYRKQSIYAKIYFKCK